MLTPSHPLLALWRASNRQITDVSLDEQIARAYARVDAIAKRTLTSGARDLAASFIVRISFGYSEERDTLKDIVQLLTGGRP